MLVVVTSLARGAETLTVIADGQSSYAIAYAEDVDQKRVKRAAEGLQFFLAEATGVTLPIVAESAVEEGQPAIYLGWSKAARKAGIPVETVTNWSYHNEVIGEDIYLVGEDRESTIGPGPRPRMTGVYGSFKAVTAFLDDQVGVRFLMPGKYGTYVPETERLEVDARMKVQWEPLFDYMAGRMGNFYPRHQRDLVDTAYGFASHMFGPSEFLYDYGGHSYYSAVPEKEYWESHPEYFAEVGGIRRGKGNHLCISNPEVQELMLKEMERQLDRGFEWVELEQTDGYIPCECDQCAAIHPDPNERVWIVHRKLAEEMNRRRPGKTIMLTSYQPTRLPPKSFDSFPENVAIRMTRYRPRDFQIWEEWGGKDLPKSNYTTNWLTVHPRVSPYVAVNQVRLFRRNNLRGMYLCGGLIQGGRGNWYPWGLGGPGYYAFFKALHDPSVEPVAMRAEYVNAAFGEAAPAMQNFFAELDERMDHFWSIYRADPVNSPPSALAAKGGEFATLFYPPRLLKNLDRSLERAKNLAESPATRAHLRLVELEYEYLKEYALVQHVYRAYQLAPSETMLGMLEEQVKRYKATVERIWPDGEPTEIEGLPSPFASTVPKVHRLDNGAPINWDYDLLREKGVLPGVGMSRVEANRVDGITLDGSLDDAAWQALSFAEVGEIGMGKPPYHTAFKIGYDAESLYIGFVGELDSAQALAEIEPVGQDGTAWRQENMELVIDPLGTRRMYYHFILNPVPNSTLDRRFGYHQEPDNLLYQKFEWDWNGDWDYAVQIDEQNQRWTAEMKLPFSTLEAEPPSKGATWTLNIGRTQYLKGDGRHGQRVNYLWSPNIQSQTFHDMSAFGELVFR